jgi:hypothetical protein
MGKMRVYPDASVFGGYFDDEFAGSIKPFFDAILAGQATALRRAAWVKAAILRFPVDNTQDYCTIVNRRPRWRSW